MSTLLSKRETDVLLLLGCHRYLSRSQIQEFLLSESQTTALSREVIGKRLLGSLRSKALVAATKRLVGGPGGGSTRLGYYLTTAGVKLARSLNLDLPARRPASGGTFLMQHALMTADVALAFRRSAQSRRGHALIDWECDWQAAANLVGSPALPDARLIYATAENEIDALLEIDLGTEGTRFFARKILRYIELFRSRTWQGRLPQWPAVLTVTRDERRAIALQQCTESVLIAQPDRDNLLVHTEFGFAGLPEVTHDPMAIIWRIAGRSGHHALLDGRHLE